MRHRQAGRKLGRTMAHREMMMRNLVTSLVLYEKIITTAAKAKDLRGVAEKMVTLAKREDLHARRQAAEVLNDDKALKKLFETIGARFRERNGGYTRITKLDYRMGDGAPLAAIEFLGAEPRRRQRASPSPAVRRRRRERALPRLGAGVAGEASAAVRRQKRLPRPARIASLSAREGEDVARPSAVACGRARFFAARKGTPTDGDPAQVRTNSAAPSPSRGDAGVRPCPGADGAVPAGRPTSSAPPWPIPSAAPGFPGRFPPDSRS